jgi:hypothetical protein
MLLVFARGVIISTNIELILTPLVSAPFRPVHDVIYEVPSCPSIEHLNGTMVTDFHYRAGNNAEYVEGHGC